MKTVDSYDAPEANIVGVVRVILSLDHNDQDVILAHTHDGYRLTYPEKWSRVRQLVKQARPPTDDISDT